MRPVALVLVGSRNLNKRTCRFAESLRDSGFDPVILAVPRRAWGTSAIEDPTLVADQRFLTSRPAGPRRHVPTRPDLVVCMHWSVLPVALLLKTLFRVRLIYDEHDHYELLALEGSGPPWVNRVRSWCVRRVHAWCLPRVDLVTCVRLASSRLKQHLEAKATAVVELHNYPSRRWAVPGRDRHRSGGSIALVYVGGIWAEKGCRAMLDAFLLLGDDESLPPLTLHVFGRGDPEIERRLGASPRVTFHGSSSYDSIVGFLAGHDCVGLVLLDDTPRYSMVSTNCHKLYEYLASGAPVVATAVGEIPEIVTSLDAGWMIGADYDAVDLAATLREIISRPHEIRRRGDAAAAAVERDALWWDGEWQKVERLGVLDRPHHV